MKMFTVYDSKAEVYIPPFTMHSVGEAVRGFITALNIEGSDYCKYPADFTLFQIGDFDESTATIKPDTTFTNLGNGVALKPRGSQSTSSEEVRQET